MLIVFGGRPGVGKTTIARALAQGLGATYLRIDEIEQAMQAAGLSAIAIGPAGYGIASALAVSNLANGQMVVADCVNPVPESRQCWRDAAARAAVPLQEVELICSDAVEHRRRIDSRRADIAGHELPTWDSICAQDYADWPEPHLVIDTALFGPEDVVATIRRAIGR